MSKSKIDKVKVISALITHKLKRDSSVFGVSYEIEKSTGTITVNYNKRLMKGCVRILPMELKISCDEMCSLTAFLPVCAKGGLATRFTNEFITLINDDVESEYMNGRFFYDFHRLTYKINISLNSLSKDSDNVTKILSLPAQIVEAYSDGILKMMMIPDPMEEAMSSFQNRYFDDILQMDLMKSDDELRENYPHIRSELDHHKPSRANGCHDINNTDSDDDRYINTEEDEDLPF